MKECPVCHHHCGDLAVKCPECNKLLFDVNRPDIVQVPNIIRMKSIYNANVPNESSNQNFINNNIDSYGSTSTETDLFQGHKSLLEAENFGGNDYSINETLAFGKSAPIDIDANSTSNMYYAPPNEVASDYTAQRLALLEAQREELNKKRIEQEQLREQKAKEEQLKIQKAKEQQELNARQAEEIRNEHLEKIRIAREKLEEVRIAEENAVKAQSQQEKEQAEIVQSVNSDADFATDLDNLSQQLGQIVPNENGLINESDEQTKAEIARQIALKEESERLTKIEQEKA
ncbi:MAG: hypothetical protein RSA99_06065, partial [Oscillospiraceae bacterium]